MLALKYSGRIKKDFKICQKRGYDLSLLSSIIDKLRIPEPLPAKHREHFLIGNYAAYRECHSTPDWLSIYRQTETYLELARTGIHSDLFG